jgi:GTPase
MFDEQNQNWEIISRLVNLSEFIDLKNCYFPVQPQEIEQGNREYKISLDFSRYSPKSLENILNKKATQMNFRLFEGGGTAVYFIGVSDKGNTDGIDICKLFKSLVNFTKIVNISKSKYKKIRIYKGKNGFISTIRVYKKIDNLNLLLEL